MFNSNNIKVEKINNGILENIITLKLPAKKFNDELKNTTLKMIPYYAWNNRKNSSMVVWIPFIKK